ncbi:MAG: FKBP-type peptidyl-prolyl cis-trans isomerase [Bacteroidales bacterium]|nr:FKBP-type peptidyl-prolyl cis-trans isomerase [Bacteroidales bacterium]
MKKINILGLFILLLIIACSQGHRKPKSDEEVLAYKEPLVKVNAILVDRDSLKIARYCKRNNLKLTVGKNGLWYQIQHIGKGDSAQYGKVANIKYKVWILETGKICYCSDSSGIKSFRVGKDDVESGLDIGIRMMREGDKAMFILPPNLAYGLLGDEKCIPARSIIVYEVELVKVTPQ